MEGNSIKEYIAIIVSPSLFGVAMYFIKDFFKENKEALSTMEKKMDHFMLTVTNRVDAQMTDNRTISKTVNEKLHSMAMDVVSIKKAINEEILGMKERLLEVSRNPAVVGNEKLERFINVYKENTGKLVEFMEKAKENFGKVIQLEETTKRHEELLQSMFKIATANHDQYVRIKAILDEIAKKKERV